MPWPAPGTARVAFTAQAGTTVLDSNDARPEENA